jgi:hypothetical protein
MIDRANWFLAYASFDLFGLEQRVTPSARMIGQKSPTRGEFENLPRCF